MFLDLWLIVPVREGSELSLFANESGRRAFPWTGRGSTLTKRLAAMGEDSHAKVVHRACTACEWGRAADEAKLTSGGSS